MKTDIEKAEEILKKYSQKDTLELMGCYAKRNFIKINIRCRF